MFSLSGGYFWLEMDGKIITPLYTDRRQISLEGSNRYGINIILLELIKGFQKIVQFIYDPVPQEIIDVIRSGAWKKWRSSTFDITERGEVKDELRHYKQDFDLSFAWWEDRRFNADYCSNNSMEIMLWQMKENELCLYWWIDKEDKQWGHVLVEPGIREIVLEKSVFLLAVHDFTNQLAAALLLRVDELKSRGLIDIDVMVADSRGTEWFGAENILNELEEYLFAFDEAMSGTYDRSTDWPATLAAIRALEPLIGPLF